MVGRLGMVVPVLPAWIFGGDGAGRVVARVAACRGAALGGVLVTVPPPPAVPGESRVNALAAEIRRVDPRHDLGAGALAEALLPFVGDIVEAARRDAREEIAVLQATLESLGKSYDETQAERDAALAEVARLRAGLEKAREIIGEKIAARIAAEQEWAETADEAVEAARRDALDEVVRALYGMTGRSSEWDDALDEALAAVTDLAEHPAASLSATHADQTPVPRTPRTDGAQNAVQGREGER